MFLDFSFVGNEVLKEGGVFAFELDYSSFDELCEQILLGVDHDMDGNGLHLRFSIIRNSDFLFFCSMSWALFVVLKLSERNQQLFKFMGVYFTKVGMD